jgi:hypothetical protein
VFVVRLTTVSVVPELKLAKDEPEVIVNVTGLLNAGEPLASWSVIFTAVWLLIPTESGFTATVMLAGVGGGGVPIVRLALLFSVPAATLTSMIVSPGFAV